MNTEKILVAVAWPYPNGPLHLGRFVGAYLPADIFARYHRLRGNEVLMVSGTDSHGTPVVVTADEENSTPAEVFQRYHHIFLESFVQLGISFDLFTHTDTENHHALAQEWFARIFQTGGSYKATEKQLYCVDDARFLPDRYIGGECPICHYARARGDQCENCGNLLDALQLINPQCKFAKPGETHRLEVRETEQFYLDLAKFNKPLYDWVKQQTHWRPNVLKFTLNYLRGDGTDDEPKGLRGRAISRDLDWGIPIPKELGEFPDKRIYVWFEAVLGYFTACIEWGKNNARDGNEWWTLQEHLRHYYFIGKDNIPFHTVIWPAMLLAFAEGALPAPYDVPANEFLNLEGRKFSTSGHWAVWVNDYLKEYDPDPLRYVLAVNMPQYADTDFAWFEFVRRNNDELVATWGNLANRALTFAYKNFNQQVPTPGHLTDDDHALINASEHAFETVGDALAEAKFKEGILLAFEVAQQANRYLNATEPWKTIKVDRERAATSIYVALRVIDNLKTLLYPYLPFSSSDLHKQLGYDDDLAGTLRIETVQESTRSHEALVYDKPNAHAQWAPSQLVPGQKLREPKALFKKLDDSVVAKEVSKLGKAA